MVDGEGRSLKIRNMRLATRNFYELSFAIQNKAMRVEKQRHQRQETHLFVSHSVKATRGEQKCRQIVTF
jgi:hypothetical protein